jgi:hypothetical protein
MLRAKPVMHARSSHPLPPTRQLHPWGNNRRRIKSSTHTRWPTAIASPEEGSRKDPGSVLASHVTYVEFHLMGGEEFSAIQLTAVSFPSDLALLGLLAGNHLVRRSGFRYDTSNHMWWRGALVWNSTPTVAGIASNEWFTKRAIIEDFPGGRRG